MENEENKKRTRTAKNTKTTKTTKPTKPTKKLRVKKVNKPAEGTPLDMERYREEGKPSSANKEATPAKIKQPAAQPKQAPKQTAKKTIRKTPKKSSKKSVKISFLGGVGEIGKNMTVVEYGEDIIIIDAGIIFPSEELPGIDLVAPDISYLVANKHKVRGLLLTHGHEDHIGGVPYFLREINVPVIGTKLTLALVDNKLREHRINNAKEIVVAPGDRLSLGVFDILFVNVNHSIAGALALAIYTPQGVIFHSGDYKIDLTPVAGEPIDLKTISDIGSEGVLLYMGESTNIERPGYTMSETVVGTTLDRLFAENLTRRIIIATFASNVHRLQQIVDLAVKYKRKIALSGRSMLNVADVAEGLGELKIPDGVLLDISHTKKLADSELVIVSTGSQGEPMSALTRMANGDNPSVTVGENDTIIISANPIPGNERDVYRVINNLYRKGAEVVYEQLENIHVSGHACREEHKIMHRLLKPKFFIPVHGEYRHLKKHAELALELGMKRSNIFIPDIGSSVLLTKDTLKQTDSVPSGARLIDGDGIEDEKASTVMADRRQLAADGLFIVSVVVSGGEVIGEPAINSRGFIFGFHKDYNEEIRSVIKNAIYGYDLTVGSVDELKRAIKKTLKNYLYKKTKQSPMIVPVVVEL
ncbi:MAG: ribonuclease J [Clostridia bacterium]|nr:ribonuclease J [Clostridia bacterium]